MQPSTPTPLSPAPNQYDFIVNTGKGGANWLVTASLKTRIIIVSVGVLVLLLVVWIGIALFTASATGSVQNLTILVQEQTELVRVAQDPLSNATLQTTKDFAMNLRLSLASDRQVYTNYLQTYNTTLSAQIMAAKLNKQTDSALQAAKAAGTYDAVYLATTQRQLNTYSNDLKTAYTSAANTAERKLFSDAYKHAQLLLVQSKDTD